MADLTTNLATTSTRGTTSRRTRGVDRLGAVLLGLALVLAAVAAWEWRLDLTGRLGGALDLSALQDATGTTWWPWAAAVAGVLLGLVGLRWLVAHLPRLTSVSARLAESDASGRLEVDLGSLARTLAGRWEALAPVSGVRGRTSADLPDVVVLTGHVDLEADATTLVDAAAQVEREVAEAFPGGEVRVRFLLEGPARQRRTRRSTDIAVEESTPAPA